MTTVTKNPMKARGTTNGYEKALKALREERNLAWEKAELHYLRAKNSSDIAAEHHQGKVDYYNAMADALTCLITHTMKQL